MDLKICDPTFEVPCGQTLTQQFHAMHLCLDTVPAVVSESLSPDRATEAFRATKRPSVGDCARGVGFQGLHVRAELDDRGGSDGIVALVRFEDAISRDGGDLLIRWDLLETVGQYRRVPCIPGDRLGHLYLQCCLVDPDVDRAPEVSVEEARRLPIEVLSLTWKVSEEPSPS